MTSVRLPHPTVKSANPFSFFDRNAAGYSTSIGRHLAKALEETVIRMDCPKECETSCPRCLMDYEQRFRASRIDRHLGWLS